MEVMLKYMRHCNYIRNFSLSKSIPQYGILEKPKEKNQYFFYQKKRHQHLSGGIPNLLQMYSFKKKYVKSKCFYLYKIILFCHFMEPIWSSVGNIVTQWLRLYYLRNRRLSSHKTKRVQHQSIGFCGLRKIWQVNIDFGSTEKDKIMKVVIDHF